MGKRGIVIPTENPEEPELEREMVEQEEDANRR
jgi:hypothetical protein